jgi:hypothetical protein
MPQLANNDVAGLFTISVEDWKAVSKRVGAVMAVALIQDDVTRYLPGYSDLRQHSILWQNNIFPGLITQSKTLASYAAKAISDFSALNKAAKQLDNSRDVPPTLQMLIVFNLKQLKDDTLELINSFGVLSVLLMMFLNDNKQVDMQMEKSKDELGIFWKPLGQIITSLEEEIGRVTGIWNAIADDLQYAITTPVNVTKAYIESLNLEAAINIWEKVQAEAGAFASKVEEQAKYWSDPFKD